MYVTVWDSEWASERKNKRGGKIKGEGRAIERQTEIKIWEMVCHWAQSRGANRIFMGERRGWQLPGAWLANFSEDQHHHRRLREHRPTHHLRLRFHLSAPKFVLSLALSKTEIQQGKAKQCTKWRKRENAHICVSLEGRKSASSCRLTWREEGEKIHALSLLVTLA